MLIRGLRRNLYSPFYLPRPQWPLFPTAYRLGILWHPVVSTMSVLVLACLIHLASI